MLVYIFGLISRSTHNPMFRRAFMGVIFGLAAIHSMTSPLEFGDGHNLDLRNLFIGASAAFFGWIAGVIALAMGIAMRLSIGGNGALFGIAAMIIAAFGGLFWSRMYPYPEKRKTRSLIILGAIISTHLTVSIFLPLAPRTLVLAELAPFLLGANTFGALLIGRLLRREETMIGASNRLERAAHIDPLTDLINRRSLMDEVANLPTNFDEKNGRAVLFLDIDHFKTVNDSYGHLKGDFVLQGVVKRIRRTLRKGDLFARFGGDEFAVVLPYTSKKEARLAGERICIAVSETPFWVDGLHINVTISMGIFWTNKAASFDSLLSNADTELYVSKGLGRNRLSFKSDLEPLDA